MSYKNDVVELATEDKKISEYQKCNDLGQVALDLNSFATRFELQDILSVSFC